MLRYSALVYFIFATALHAQTIYENSRIVATSADYPINTITFGISKNGEPPPWHFCADCDTAITFQYDGARINVDNVTLDEGSDWFLVQPGDRFSRATINAGQFPTIVNYVPTPVSGEVTVGSGEFYLGVSTGTWHTRHRNVYGWVHLRPVDGVLTMVSNVMSYNSPVIIVGTTTLVPEPATWALVTIAGLACLSRRRRNAKLRG